MESLNHFSRSPGRGRTLSRTLLSTWLLLTCIPVSWLWLSFSTVACHRPRSPRHENSFFIEGKMDFDLPVPGRGASNATSKRLKVPLAPQEELTIPHRTMAFRDTGAQRAGERLFIVFHFTNTVKTNPANRIADSAGPGK